MDINANISQAIDSQTLNKVVNLSDVKKAKNLARIDKASKDFEAVFLGEMIRPMFDTVEVDPIMGGGHAEETYRSMLVDEYAKNMVKNGGIGLAAQVKKEMLKVQEGNK